MVFSNINFHEKTLLFIHVHLKYAFTSFLSFNHQFRIEENTDNFESLASIPRRGGGYLVYLSNGDVLFLRVSFSPKGKFSGAGCQDMSKEEILLQRFIIQSNFCIFEYTLHRFF